MARFAFISDTAEGQGAGEGGSRDPVGSPLLDPSDAAVKKLIRCAKEAWLRYPDQRIEAKGCGSSSLRAVH
jgi:hypothetical protein